MREIKFRGICKVSGEWVYGVPIPNSFGDRVFIIPLLLTDKIAYPFERLVDRVVEVWPETISQYTGLKDKNGVEIFEGDYVVGVQYLTTSPNVPFEIRGVVRYSERNTMFYIGDKEKGHDIFMQSLGSTPYILEVIGNIYENSDLI